MKYSVFFIITLASNVLFSMDKKMVTLCNQSSAFIFVTYVSAEFGDRKDHLEGKQQKTISCASLSRIGVSHFPACLPDVSIPVEKVEKTVDIYVHNDKSILAVYNR